jgi:hypothetical protein
MHPFRSGLPATALLLAATPPAHGVSTPATLVNRTDQTWRIRPAILFGQRTAVALAQSGAPGSPERIQTAFNEQEPPTIDLPPHSEIEISHEQASGQRFTGWFNLDPAGTGSSAGATRSGLNFYYETRPGLLFRWRQQTTLGGAANPSDDQLQGYRFRQISRIRMVLEEVSAQPASSFDEDFPYLFPEP